MTIVGFIDEVPTIYRLGGLSVDDIEAVIGKVNILPHSSSNPQAPGMLKSHYAPRKPFFIKTREELEQIDRQGIGCLLFDRSIENKFVSIERVLTRNGDLHEAAQHLFAFLRELDTSSIDEIWAEMAPAKGLGLAINDRLRRAAAI